MSSRKGSFADSWLSFLTRWEGFSLTERTEFTEVFGAHFELTERLRHTEFTERYC